MTNAFIALMLAVGAGGWTYAKMMRRTGNNTQNSLVMAGIAAVAGFLVMLYILSLVPKP